MTEVIRTNVFVFVMTHQVYPNLLLQSNALHLDGDTLWQLLSGDAASGWLDLSGEPLGVDGVHSGEVSHIGKEDRGLDDLGHVGSSSLQHQAHVLQHLFLHGSSGPALSFDESYTYSALLDVASNQVSFGISGDLARAEDQSVDLDGLGLLKR